MTLFFEPLSAFMQRTGRIEANEEAIRADLLSNPMGYGIPMELAKDVASLTADWMSREPLHVQIRMARGIVAMLDVNMRGPS